MRDRTTLEGAREMLAQAFELGHDTPRAAKLVQQAVKTLGVESPVLSQEDLGILLDLDSTTVSKYRTRSKPGGRMASHPFPRADNEPARYPIWMVTRVPELFRWQATRPGRGAGGGRPWHAAETPQPELLDGLPKDWWTVENVLTYLKAVGQPITRKTLLKKVDDGELSQAERMFGTERAWTPATIQAWRPAR